MTVDIATLFSVPVGLVTIAAIAIGTSLPELFVSLQAMRNGEVELAIGNIFGSNAFNLLVVIGIPALISPLTSEPSILKVGLPILIAASAIFFVTGLSRQIMRWEGMMMLLFFAFFIIKLVSVV
jgi:cation:H+ antiporter